MGGRKETSFLLVDTDRYPTSKSQIYYEGFEQNCSPKSNLINSRFKFKSRAQEYGEQFESFVTDLKVLIKDCGYPANIYDELIRDYIVFGVKSVKIREKLINEGSELTLAKCIDIENL